MKRLWGLLALGLAACPTAGLDGRVYQCDATRACVSGYRCDCGTCVKCSGAQCDACQLNTDARSWWRLDTLDDGRANDCTGHHRDGLVSDGAQTLVDGAVDKAWVGGTLVASEVTLGRGASSAGSVSFWVGTAGTDGVIYEERALDGGTSLQLGISGAADFQLSTDQQHWFNVPAGRPAPFHHVALVSDATMRLQLLVDGTPTPAQLPLLRVFDVARFTLRHPIDEVRSFDRALGDDDVRQLAQRACAAP